MNHVPQHSVLSALFGAAFAVAVLLSAEVFVPEQVVASVLGGNSSAASARSADRASVSGYTSAPRSNTGGIGSDRAASSPVSRSGSVYTNTSRNTTPSSARSNTGGIGSDRAASSPTSNTGSRPTSGSLNNYGNSNNTNYTSYNPLSGGNVNASLNALGVRATSRGIGSDFAASAPSTRVNTPAMIQSQQAFAARIYNSGVVEYQGIMLQMPNGDIAGFGVPRDGQDTVIPLADGSNLHIRAFPNPNDTVMYFEYPRTLTPRAPIAPATTLEREAGFSDYLRSIASYLSPVGSANASPYSGFVPQADPMGGMYQAVRNDRVSLPDRRIQNAFEDAEGVRQLNSPQGILNDLRLPAFMERQDPNVPVMLTPQQIERLLEINRDNTPRTPEELENLIPEAIRRALENEGRR